MGDRVHVTVVLLAIVLFVAAVFLIIAGYRNIGGVMWLVAFVAPIISATLTKNLPR